MELLWDGGLGGDALGGEALGGVAEGDDGDGGLFGLLHPTTKRTAKMPKNLIFPTDLPMSSVPAIDNCYYS